ncbi:MAG: ABC transporter permease [Mojavia pulchra JT2-VF2]|jgi:lipooligosaccharide transport system permease protein|uniref:Transport permease protein n=1 Tax=Mojavia pulchra JT2-VF2 TaxID=287848 RepID=A0A951Q0Y0_9NOST|nr:ABC transporter permease [Mojavia pulchra JT2-VF2]
MKFNSSITVWGIYSVWRRNAKVYQHTWLVNLLPPILEPLIYLVAFGYGLTPLVGEITYGGRNISYLEFIAPGTIAIGVLNQSFFEGAYGSFIRLKFQRTWQALLTAPLTFAEVFLGEWLWAATRGLIAGLATAIVVGFWGLYSGWNLLLSLPLICLGCLLFAAMGLLAAGIVRTVDQLNVPIFLLIVPMFTICGTYFPRETLPPILQKVANVLPLSAFVDLLRWPLNVPEWWLAALMWLLLLMGGCMWLAWRQIYPQLFR